MYFSLQSDFSNKKLKMSGGAYKNFVRVLEKWPVDKNKTGKDLGEALRVVFSKTFPSGSSSSVTNEKLLNRQIAALDSLISNKSLNSFPVSSKSTFTGLDAETLSQITGTELMGQVSKQSEQNITFFQKLKNFQIR